MSKKISLKRIRREIMKSETRLAQGASEQFKIFTRKLPIRGRLILAYKIIRGIL